MSDLKHYGVLGMRWGRRKNISSEETSNSSHDKAVATLNSSKASRYAKYQAKMRLKREKLVDLVNKENKPREARQMTDRELINFLRSPVMKKKYKDIELKQYQKQRRIVQGIFATGVLAYRILNTPIVKNSLYRYAKKVGDARRYAKVSPDVIDVAFK